MLQRVLVGRPHAALQQQRHVAGELHERTRHHVDVPVVRRRPGRDAVTADRLGAEQVTGGMHHVAADVVDGAATGMTGERGQPRLRRWRRR